MDSSDFYTEIQLAATTAAPLFSTFRWAYGNGVPDIYEIEDMITRLVDEVTERFDNKPGRYMICSGRFSVLIDEDSEGGAYLNINLELAEGYKDGSI